LARLGLEKRLDDLQAKGIAELEETRDEALRMVADKLDAFMKELPAVGAAFAESTVQTVFEHTQVDEAANQVSGVVTGILDRLPFGLGRP
jgi:hypothetical protein